MKPRPGTKRAAVLVPFVSVRGSPHVLFTIKSAALRSHAGQASFPGGHIDTHATSAVEETPFEAAVRETREELGIEPGAPLGLHDDGFALGTHVTPVISTLPGDFSGHLASSLHLNPAEVDSVFTLSLEHLSDPGNRTIEYLDPKKGPILDGWPARRVAVPSFLGGPVPVWGYTAYQLNRMLESLLLPALREYHDALR